MAGLREAMCVRDRVILIDRQRSRSERRCDLAHAIAHIELEHRDRRNERDEAAAVRYAAKMLIDVRDLGDALHHSAGVLDDIAADYLDVDMETLTVRCQHLHPSERAYLRERLASLS